MGRRQRVAVAALTVSAAALSAATRVSAGGLYFSDRGVRPLGRGGAFVAGADDAGAITYNPAGLAFAGSEFLFDASWMHYTSSYQRKALLEQIDPNTGLPTGQTFVQTFPAVEGSTPLLPIPTIVYTNNFGLPDNNFAIGLWAPYSAITSYPERVAGQPAPQRYSLISLDGSTLVIPGVYGSWLPDDLIALGAGVEMLTGYFQTSVVFSACVPDRFICAPEQPEYDASSQLRVGPIFAPSGIIGAIVKPADMVRVGVSFHLPVWVDAPATVSVRLPSASVFENASQEGDQANVDFRLPWTLRTGLEVRPIEQLRLEVGAAVEGWSMHDEISVTPDDIVLRDVEAFPERYRVTPLSIERRFQNSWSARFGGELSFPVGSYALDVRAGVMHEKSAIPPAYLNAATIDLDKTTFSMGGSLHIGKWRFDGVIARVLGSSVTVELDEQRVEQVNPVRANPPPQKHYINAGVYQANATVLGIGLVYQFDAPSAPPSTAPAARESQSRETPPAPAATAPTEPARKPAPTPKPEKGDEEFEKEFEKEVGH